MRRILTVSGLVLVLALAGCAGGSTVAESASPRPTSTPTASPTPTPSATPAPSVAPPAAKPSDDELVVAPLSPSAEPFVPVDPNAVNVADYPSHAVDDATGQPRTGVEFSAREGNLTCGISDGLSGRDAAGTAVCTVRDYEKVFPGQSSPNGPQVRSVIVEPGIFPASLYGGYYETPHRLVPELAPGKSITFAGTTCMADTEGVTCRDVFNRGFVVTLDRYELLGG